MKTKTHYAVMISTLSLFAISCRKEIAPSQPLGNDNTMSTANSSSANAENPRTINVSTVYELYDAVNEVENEGSEIVLAPGKYTLESNYPTSGATGRLELQRDMSLKGQPGHPDWVLIDASTLPPSSFSLPVIPGQPAKTGAIRIGRGFNKITWLKVKGNPSSNALSAIDTDLSSGTTSVEIAHLIVTESQAGIDIRNGGSNSAGRILDADIHDNEFMDNQVAAGRGIVVQNSVGATGATITVNMKGNYCHDNRVGFKVWNNNTNSGKITIRSADDRFDNNGLGCYIHSGTQDAAATAATSANDNFVSFEAHGTSIQNNRGTLPPDLPPACGVYVVGGFSKVGSKASNNRLEINLTGCRIAGNSGTHDIIAFGAFSPSINPAGTNNIVNMKLNGIANNTTISAIDSSPAEGTNTISIR